MSDSEPKPPTVDLAGVPIFDGSIPQVVDYLVETCDSDQERTSRCVSLTGAHGIVYAQHHPGFKDMLNDFHLNLPDGMPGVWVTRLKGAQQIERCYGPSVFEAVMRATADTGITHYLTGGKEGVADKLKVACEQKFGNHNIVGTHCPPFLPVEEYDYEAIAREIDESGADIVWVGLSTPKQEQYARNLARNTSVHFLFCVGAAFDFHIGNVRQAPHVIQRIGMEWLFRMLMEPGRLAKRYAEIVPKFLWYAGKDLWRDR